MPEDVIKIKKTLFFDNNILIGYASKISLHKVAFPFAVTYVRTHSIMRKLVYTYFSTKAAIWP